jgi:hypothetical protein
MGAPQKTRGRQTPNNDLTRRAKWCYRHAQHTDDTRKGNFMKTSILGAILLLTSFTGNALASAPKIHEGICAWNNEESPNRSNYDERRYNIDKMDSVPSQVLKALNQFVQGQLDDSKVRSFEEIKRLAKEEFQDGIGMSIQTEKSTGVVLIYLWSYPGDNQYGVVYNLKTLAIVGSIEDGDMYASDLRTGKSVSCH